MKDLFEVNYKNLNTEEGMAIIYIIYSPYSDIIYIGNTIKNLKERKNEHLRYLRKNNHHCKALQELYNYIGEDNIKFRIVDKCQERNRKYLERYYHTMNELEYAVCSHKHKGCEFFWDFYDYKTEPYFEPLRKNEKFLIKIYMDYYRQKDLHKYFDPSELLNEALKSGIKLVEDETYNKEFRTIITNVLQDLDIEEVNIHDTTSKYIYIKMLYDIYEDRTDEAKKMFIDYIYKERNLYRQLLSSAIAYSTEFETGKVNTLKYMNRVINHIFNSYNPRKPRYSDLVYYYWIEECCRYLFKRKYSW
ncbi:hypothetical protein FDB50_03270 [Clostridium botulinum]|nr:hypothetical protein [Clostridium botulinum]